jgi:tetratricopeptide (TPR) repeat protein
MEDRRGMSLLNVLRRMLRGEANLDAELFMEALEKANEDRVKGILFRYSDRAEKFLREMLVREPNNFLILATLAYLYEAKGRCSEAEEMFKQGIASCRNERDKAYLHYCYALLLEGRGEFDGAKTEMIKAIELDGLEVYYLLKYAELLWNLGERRRARKFCLRAMHMLPPGDPLKNRIKEAFKLDMMDFLLTPPPTAGALTRFIRFHGDELAHRISEVSREVRERLRMLKSKTEDRRLVEIGGGNNYVEMLLKIDKEKNSVSEDPEEWAVSESLNVLNHWKPGFELYLSQLFFQNRCSECRYPRKHKLNCDQGFADCILDPEYDEYVYETVQRIVEELKAGIDPSQIPELQIPEALQNIERNIRNALETTS